MVTAKEAGRKITDYATTLAAVLISDDLVVAANIGDIAAYAVHLKDDKPTSKLTAFGSASQPPKTATYAITHAEWQDLVTVRDSTSPHLKAVVLATDGANGFFIDETANGVAFDTTFLDAFDNAVSQLTPRRFCNFFATYLFKNEADNDDDRTLLVA